MIDGLDALALFHHYQRSNDESTRRRLIAYCRDDVNALIYVVGKLRDSTARKDPRPKRA